MADSEKEEAMTKLAKVITCEIRKKGFKLDTGPFSEAAMGGSAVQVISKASYDAILNGEWHWPEENSFEEQLIVIAKSKISHIIRDYFTRGCPELQREDDLSPKEQAAMNLANQMDMEVQLRDWGYEQAENVFRRKPKVLAFLKAMYKTNDYRSIASCLGITKREVLELEKEMLDCLANL